LAEAHAGLGKLAEKTGDIDRATGHYRRALSLAPSLASLDPLLENYQERLSHAGRLAPARESHTTFWKRFAYANELQKKRSYDAAEIILRDLLDLEPDNAPVLGALGALAAQLGRPEEALALLDRAIAAEGDLFAAQIARSDLLDANGDIDGAIAAVESVLQRDATITAARDRLRSLRNRRDGEANETGEVAVQYWPANVDWSVPAEQKQLRVAVVSWCLAHNPVGRALTLAEVAHRHAECEIVGPIFSTFGDSPWPPLIEGERKVDIRGFRATSFSTFMEGAIRIVLEKPCDVAWVSKPRLPSLLIGFLYKLVYGATVVLDVDDDELLFVRADRTLTLDEFFLEVSQHDWREPYGQRWTQLAGTLASAVDGVTACNPVLGERFGGVVVRHAREAKAFEDARARRKSLRAEFGFSDLDKVVLFLGTARRHKGILDVAKALRKLADSNAVFCIIGTILDKTLRTELESMSGLRIVFHPDQPYSRLAELNTLADVVCVLQDSNDPIAQWQTPAKLTDAIATGTPVLVTDVPPVRDILEGAGIVAVSDDNLVDALRAALSAGRGDLEAAEVRRSYFRNELSIEANSGRALEAIRKAQQINRPVSSDALRLLKFIDDSMLGSLPKDVVDATRGVFRSEPRLGKLRTLRKDVNLVFFWKQNDSGLFGRRQDMLLKQFAAMPNIRKILHIDAPISIDALNTHAVVKTDGSLQGRLIASNTVNRHLCAMDDDRIARRSFIYGGRDKQLLGRDLPPFEAFPNAVEGWLRELDMMDNLLAWVCPVVRGFPEIQKRLGFSFVASDVIDDQRQWPMQPAWRVQLERYYRDTFACTNVAFANCQPVAEWLEREGLRPLVVPNGIDVRENIDSWEVPTELARLPRPVVGYCGNLTQRIDWDLIDGLAAARPAWSFVFIGEPANDERCRQVAMRPNIRFLGMIPYENAVRHVAAFDAAMIPHLDSDLSRHMNPLKMYVYRSVGVPVVSTPVANLDDLAGEIRVAGSVDEFVAQLESAIEERRTKGRIHLPADLVRDLSWETRAARIWNQIESEFEAGRGVRTGSIVS